MISATNLAVSGMRSAWYVKWVSSFLSAASSTKCARSRTAWRLFKYSISAMIGGSGKRKRQENRLNAFPRTGMQCHIDKLRGSTPYGGWIDGDHRLDPLIYTVVSNTLTVIHSLLVLGLFCMYTSFFSTLKAASSARLGDYAM